MTELWNLWYIKPPPVCTVKTNLYIKEMNNLNEITSDVLKILRDDLGHFDRESAILSRFLYKYRRIFRHDKGIQYLVKVNQCLKRYLKLNMLDVIFTFKQCILLNSNTVSTHIYFPTRQMLKWVLLRLQSFSQIFVRVIELTKAAGTYIYKKLCLGWSLYNSLFVFCITARLLVTSKYLVGKSIEWYNSFYKYLPYLQETSDYLSGYNFPLDLKVWLGEVDLTPIKKTFIDEIFGFIDLVKDDEETNDDGIEKFENNEFMQMLFTTKIADINFDAKETTVQEAEEEIIEMKRPLKTSLLCEDLGVPVENNEEKALKELKSSKRKFTDQLSTSANKEGTPKKKRKRGRTGNQTFADVASVENNKGKALKQLKNRKITFDLVSTSDNMGENPNRRKRKKITFTDLVSISDHKEEASIKNEKRKRKKEKVLNDRKNKNSHAKPATYIKT